MDFHGEKRSNQTDESKTDSDTRLARKKAKQGIQIELHQESGSRNHNGLIVNAQVWESNGTAERDAALAMLEQLPGEHPVTVGADKQYDTKDFVAECWAHAHYSTRVAER